MRRTLPLYPKVSATFANQLLHLRNRHYALIDFLIFMMTPALALYLRTDNFSSLAHYAPSLLLYTLIVLLLRMGIFRYFGLYQRYWRFAGALDFAQLVLAISSTLAASVLLFTLVEMTLQPTVRLPRSVPLLDAILGLMLVGGVRASVRLTENLRTATGVRGADQASWPRPRILLVGAGYTGALLAREIRDNSQIRLHLLGFIDDDRSKHGMQIHSLPVLGGREQLPVMIERYRIERLIIAMPSADGAAIRELVAIGQRAGVTVQTMPGVHELINGNVSISKLRNVQIEDLLRRSPVETNIGAVSTLLAGKRVLVTGGGGSIGSELCRQILRCQPCQLILVGHGENSIFDIYNELQGWLEQESRADAQPVVTKLIPVIADLRLRKRLFGLFAEHQPEIVFHAAAHKHVPLMEANPVEAITNNVLGTRQLLAAAQMFNVDRFVMISTDKAVNPTNVMGASKRVAELLVLQAAQQSGRFFQVVRFGNVLGSRGSVIHTFKRQIASGGPVMVTHPEMVRYFMTIPEAVQLVLQAAVVGHGAEVLMLDMGDPVRIVDLARDLIELSGLQVGRDIDIAFSGLRPGEKLFEEMFKSNEEHRRTAHEKIFIAPNAGNALPNGLDAAVEALIAAARDNNSAAVITGLSALLPEYQPWPSHSTATSQAESTVPPSHPSAVSSGKQPFTPVKLTYHGANGA